MLKLTPNPTFKAKVLIPVPGDDKGTEILCTFKHMDRDTFAAYSAPDAAAKRTDAESVLGVLVGWDGIDAAFSPETVADLIRQYHGAAFAIVSAYAVELTKARAKN
jgi:hypothetical protein